MPAPRPGEVVEVNLVMKDRVVEVALGVKCNVWA